MSQQQQKADGCENGVDSFAMALQKALMEGICSMADDSNGDWSLVTIGGNGNQNGDGDADFNQLELKMSELKVQMGEE